jgi:hypothetical protein
MITSAIIINPIVSIILFVVGVIITKLWAGKKEWDDSWKTSILINLFWLIVMLAVGWLLYGVVALVINIVVGAYVASKLYEQDMKPSLIFVIIIMFIIYILSWPLWIIMLIIFYGSPMPM